jgi:amidase
LGLAFAALGTETSGSILSPSQQNNLVGIKPSVGLTSRYLVIPISEHQDTIGPMARTVKDAAYLLQAIAGRDPRDNYTSAAPAILPDYVGACRFDGLKGVRLGYPSNVLALYANTTRYFPVLNAYNSMIKVLQSAGAIIVDTPFTGLNEYRLSGNSSIVLGADFKTDVRNYFDELKYNPNKIKTEEQLRDWTESHPQEQWSPTSRDVTVWNNSLALGFGNKSPKFWAAYQANLYLGGEATLLGAIRRNNVTAIVMPTAFSAGFAAIVGAPVITVPMGKYPANTTVTTSRFNVTTAGPSMSHPFSVSTYTDNHADFPFGLSFMGDLFTEEKLIPLAYAYEQRTHIRDTVQPYIQPSIELSDIVKRR